MKFRLIFLSIFLFIFTQSLFANEGDTVKCNVEGFTILSPSDLNLIGELNKAVTEDACGHVPEALRDDGSPERSGIGSVILSCFSGILKGIFQSFYDSIRSVWDLVKVSKKLAGVVGEKAYKIVKALWSGGVSAVANEFISSKGTGFFASIKKNFMNIFSSIKDYFASKIKDVYQCYSPVAQGDIVCKSVAYLGTDFFAGFLFKAVGKIGKIASAAGDIFGLPGVTAKLGKFAKNVMGAHSKVKKFVSSTGPRALRKFLLRSDGLKRIVVKVTKAYGKHKSSFNVLIGRYKTVTKDYSKFGILIQNVDKVAAKYKKVDKKLKELSKKIDYLKNSIEEQGSTSNVTLKNQLHQKMTDTVIQIEKQFNQSRILGQQVENALVMLGNAQKAESVGVSVESFTNGLSVPAKGFALQ